MPNLKSFTILLLSLFLLACQKDPAPSEAQPGQQGPGATTSFLGAYVHAFNLLGESGQKIQAGLRQEKPASLRAQLGPKLEQAAQALAAATDARPENLASMDGKASRLQETTQALLEAYEQALDKDGPESTEKQQALKDRLKAWTRSIQAFGKSLELLEDERMAAEVAAREDKKDYGYWFRFFNIEAKAMVKAARAGKKEGAASLEQALGQLEEFSRAQGENINPHFARYVEQAKRLGEAAKTWAGAPDKPKRQAIDAQFNQLIDLGNGLYKLEARGTLK